MRRIALICAAAAVIVTAGTFAPSDAKAMPVTTSAALGATVADSSLAERVAYHCRQVRRCGYYGCGWRRACAWAPGYYSYGYYRPYRAWRPYYGWRRRVW